MKTNEKLDKLLNYLIKNDVNNNSFIDFNKLNFYDDFEQFKSDCDYLKKNKFIDFNLNDNSKIVISFIDVEKINKCLGSIQYKKYLILYRIAKTEQLKQINLNDLKDENINMNDLEIIIDDLIKNNFIEAQCVKYTTNKYPSYFFKKITLNGKQFLENDDLSKDMIPELKICVDNSIIATNGSNISINDSFNYFKYSKNSIENIENVSENDKKEIINKINEIEKVINSNNKKDLKKSKLKKIFAWLIDKSIEVGIAILPHFFK